MSSGRSRSWNGNSTAIRGNGSAVCAVNSRKNFDESRFAGTVVADYRYDLAGVDIQVHVRERLNRSEILRDPSKAQNGFPRHSLLGNRSGLNCHDVSFESDGSLA